MVALQRTANRVRKVGWTGELSPYTSHLFYHVRHRYYDRIDQEAEREAKAMETMSDFAGLRPPVSRIRLAAEAEERGIKEFFLRRYAREAAITAHLKMIDTFRAGKIYHIAIKWQEKCDVQRISANRDIKCEKLQCTLAKWQNSGPTEVTTDIAAVMCGYPYPTIKNWVQKGIVVSRKEYGGVGPSGKRRGHKHGLTLVATDSLKKRLESLLHAANNPRGHYSKSAIRTRAVKTKSQWLSMSSPGVSALAKETFGRDKYGTQSA